MNKKLIGLVSFLFFSFLFFNGVLSATNAYNNKPIVSVKDITYQSATINLSGLDNTIYSYSLKINSSAGTGDPQPINDIQSDGTAVFYATGLNQKTSYSIDIEYYNAGKVTFPAIATFTTQAGLIPKIKSFSPTSGSVGDLITIEGENFGTLTSYVMFNNVKAIPENIYSTEIKVKVPEGATGGKITVVDSYNLSVTSTENFMISNPVLGKVAIDAKQDGITLNSVKFTASGNVTSGVYHFAIFDENGYPDNRNKREFVGGPAMYTVPVDKAFASIQLLMTDLNLKPNSRYVGVVYKDNYDDTSEVHFYTEGGFDTGNEILAVDKSTDTTVTLTASGFVKGQNYDIYLSSDTTSGTAININNDKKSSPVSAEFGGATVSFDGLVKGKQYVAYIIKNSNTKEALGRVYFTAGDASSGTNTATNTGTGTGTNISTGIAATDAEFSGIVPKCNTGDIDTATGQYKNPCNFDFFMKLLNSIIKFLLFTIATPLVALIVMYTGYLYLTAGGSAGQTEKAKHILFNVVVGYIIALAAWLIINTIVTSLLPKDTTINTFLQKDTFQK